MSLFDAIKFNGISQLYQNNKIYKENYKKYKYFCTISIIDNCNEDTNKLSLFKFKNNEAFYENKQKIIKKTGQYSNFTLFNILRKSNLDIIRIQIARYLESTNKYNLSSNNNNNNNLSVLFYKKIFWKKMIYANIMFLIITLCYYSMFKNTGPIKYIVLFPFIKFYFDIPTFCHNFSLYNNSLFLAYVMLYDNNENNIENKNNLEQFLIENKIKYNKL